LDVDGFLTERGSDVFRYTARGELLQATVGGHAITYTYDGFGRRVTRKDDSGTYQYFYGNPEEFFEITAVRGPSGILSVYYYDEDGFLFALQRGSTWYYTATDQVGTPRVVSDATGSPVRTLGYDSFGKVIADSNPAFDLPIGFAGGLTDGDTGLVRFGYRDYEAEVGRWTARDPVFFGVDQFNLYAYVSNDPVNFRDPEGTGVGSWFRKKGREVFEWAKDKSKKVYKKSKEKAHDVYERYKKKGKNAYDRTKNQARRTYESGERFVKKAAEDIKWAIDYWKDLCK
jgi:RHS repeat-associated protein